MSDFREEVTKKIEKLLNDSDLCLAEKVAILECIKFDLLYDWKNKPVKKKKVKNSE